MTPEKKQKNRESRMRHYYANLNESRKKSREYYHEKMNLLKRLKEKLNET